MSAKEELLGIAGLTFLQAGCPSCYPATGVKALKKDLE